MFSIKDVVLNNNADPLGSLSHVSTHMIVTSNGNVTWLSTSIFRSSCSINVRYFPFDDQNCSLVFGRFILTISKPRIRKLYARKNKEYRNHLYLK